MVEANTDDAIRQIVWLCRHGSRIDVEDSTWQGHDPHLSIDGTIQAKKTGNRLRGENIRHIFASPFLRTVETAFHIAEALDLSIKVEHGVCEWLNPVWYVRPPEYMPLEKLNERFPRIDLAYQSNVQVLWPEETLEKSRARCLKTAKVLLEKFDSNFLVVGHAASVLGLAKGMLGCDEAISADLCSLTTIIHKNGRSLIGLNGDTSHLSIC